MSQTSRSTGFADRIRAARQTSVIDRWSRQGDYMIFTCGTARFYVHREEARSFVEGMLHDRMDSDVAALNRSDYGNFVRGFRQRHGESPVYN